MLWRAIGVSAGLHAAVLGGLCGAGWLPAPGPGAPPLYGTLRWAPEADPGIPVLLEAPGPEAPPLLEGFSEPDAGQAVSLPAMEGFPFPAEEPIRSDLVLDVASTPRLRGPRSLQPSTASRGLRNPVGADRLPSGSGGADPWPCPPPPYPAEAASRGIEGVLEVEVQVLPDGKVGRVRLLRSSGSLVLDRCALAWIPVRWGPFQPMKSEGGEPIAYTFTRPVRFNLSGR